MRTLAFINLKGGVGKTVSAANMSHILAVYHRKKVLLVDGDKQGNASRYNMVLDTRHVVELDSNGQLSPVMQGFPHPVTHSCPSVST